jgi:pimeloyl-ACP methyl ester carboxylesterase
VPSVLVNGVRLNHVQMAAPELGGPHEDLVMVHGLATNMAFWYFHYAAVFARRYRVTVYDLRGHGRSEMTPGGYTPQSMARDLVALLDHLAIPRAHFLVHSFGGAVTLNLAQVAPERIASLVLADTHISAARGAAGQVWDYGAGIQALLDEAGVALDTRDPYFGYRLLTEVARMQLDREPVPPGLERLVGPLVASGAGRTAAQWLHLMRNTSAQKELMGEDGLTLEVLRQMRFPILAMYGDNSPAWLTGEELLHVWPHAEFRRVRNAGHFFPSSRPAEVIQACSRFWRGDFRKLAMHRAGEGSQRHFRSDRVYRAEGGWYCLTREPGALGPFSTQEDASEQLDAYISTMEARKAASTCGNCRSVKRRRAPNGSRPSGSDS